MIESRWKKIEQQKRSLSYLDGLLRKAKEALACANVEHRRIEAEWDIDDPSYRRSYQTVRRASATVSSLERRIHLLENDKPADLVFSLPEDESDGESLLFFMLMGDDIRHLVELAYRAECLLWHKQNIPKEKAMGQTVSCWLGESLGFLQYQQGLEGMIRLFCPSAERYIRTKDLRSYERRTGVLFPSVRNFKIGWKENSPFADKGQVSIQIFTETFDPEWTNQPSNENFEAMMEFMVVLSSPSRENIAPAKPWMKPSWLTPVQFKAFGSLRAGGRTQFRSLLNALFENLLPLENPCVHNLIRQLIFQLGAYDWKTDLEPGWLGLAMEAFWCREVDRLQEAPKLHENLLLAGVVCGFYGQYNMHLEALAVRCSEIFCQWACDISEETRSAELILKQARFYGYGILCLASVKITFHYRKHLLRLLVLYRDRLLLSEKETDRALEHAIMKVTGTKWSKEDRLFMKKRYLHRDLLLTSLVQDVVESAPSDLMWSEVSCNHAESTACFEARHHGRLFSINLNNGVVIVNGATKCLLPQSVTSSSLFERFFGNRSPEVSIEGIHHYRSAHRFDGHYFYDFVIDTDNQLHIVEFDSRKGFGDSERLELLDPATVGISCFAIDRSDSTKYLTQ
ncbi:unnamed protein product [Cylindrotheca closterium]|uniref:Uncharacterized protein n=1 Tax=Cylindrotheca closterium TaxID=2856 RepID=A0AAD2PUW9_9STRA|nr:unnamed protein product [Cylindrotheca closterium]